MSLRPSGKWKMRLGACAAAFVLTGIGVFLVGTVEGDSQQPAQRYTAEARVCCEAAGDRPSLVDPHTLRQRILGDATLREALSRHAQPVPDEETLTAIRRNIEWGIDETKTPEGFNVSIRYTGEDVSRTTGLVNDLARMTADLIHRQAASAETSVRDAVSQARQATGRARQLRAEALNQREIFLHEHFSHLDAEADRLQALSNAKSAAAPPAGLVSVHTAGPTGPTAENPEWVELNEQFEALRERHAELLSQRTALHPEVREAASRLAQLGRQMALVPRRVFDNEPPPDETIIPPLPPDEQQLDEPAPPRSSEEVAQQHRADATAYAKWSRQVAHADRGHERRIAEERVARNQETSAWQVRLELASVPPPGNVSPERFPLGFYSLIAALAAAASVGAISLVGQHGDRPFANVAEVQASLPVPVVGAIPAKRRPPGGEGMRNVE